MDQYKSQCVNAAQKWKVSPEVHADDFIFQFVMEHPGFQSKQDAIQYYFDDGAKSAQRLRGLLTDVCGIDVDQPFQLLEFASGYGCVSRHLGSAMPACDVLACDIHQAAIDFVQKNLKVNAVMSDSCPEELQFDQRFKVIFALSFFSHMPKRTFTRWLHQLSSLLESEGALVFTTHGLISREMFFGNCPLDADGFHFRPLTEQKDLPLQEYGSTAVHPQYVVNEIFKAPDLTLKYFHEGFWWDHQDVFIVQKKPGYGLNQVAEKQSMASKIKKALRA